MSNIKENEKMEMKAYKCNNLGITARDPWDRWFSTPGSVWGSTATATTAAAS